MAEYLDGSKDDVNNDPKSSDSASGPAKHSFNRQSDPTIQLDDEIELKALVKDSSAFKKILSHFKSRQLQPTTSKILASAYFDDKDQNLRNAGVSLRIRSDIDQNSVLRHPDISMKTQGESNKGITTRLEYENNIGLPRLNVTPLRQRYGNKKINPLLDPVNGNLRHVREHFWSNCARTTFSIEVMVDSVAGEKKIKRRAVLEFALDHTQFMAQDPQSPNAAPVIIGNDYEVECEVKVLGDDHITDKKLVSDPELTVEDGYRAIQMVKNELRKILTSADELTWNTQSKHQRGFSYKERVLPNAKLPSCQTLFGKKIRNYAPTSNGFQHMPEKPTKTRTRNKTKHRDTRGPMLAPRMA